jgi:hypothetical protein
MTSLEGTSENNVKFNRSGGCWEVDLIIEPKKFRDHEKYIKPIAWKPCGKIASSFKV